MVRGWTRPSTGRALPSLSPAQTTNQDSRRGEYDSFEWLGRLAWPQAHRLADERARARREARRAQPMVQSSSTSVTASTNQINANEERGHDNERRSSVGAASTSSRVPSETPASSRQAPAPSNGSNDTRLVRHDAGREGPAVNVNVVETPPAPTPVNSNDTNEGEGAAPVIAAYYAEPLPLYTRQPQFAGNPPPTYSDHQAGLFCANCGPRTQAHHLSSDYICGQCWSIYLHRSSNNVLQHIHPTMSAPFYVTPPFVTAPAPPFFVQSSTTPTPDTPYHSNRIHSTSTTPQRAAHPASHVPEAKYRYSSAPDGGPPLHGITPQAAASPPPTMHHHQLPQPPISRQGRHIFHTHHSTQQCLSTCPGSTATPVDYNHYHFPAEHCNTACSYPPWLGNHSVPTYTYDPAVPYYHPAHQAPAMPIYTGPNLHYHRQPFQPSPQPNNPIYPSQSPSDTTHFQHPTHESIHNTHSATHEGQVDTSSSRIYEINEDDDTGAVDVEETARANAAFYGQDAT